MGDSYGVAGTRVNRIADYTVRGAIAAHEKIRQLIGEIRQPMRFSDNSTDWTTPAPVLENGRSDQGGAS
jgi:hypothetical protein